MNTVDRIKNKYTVKQYSDAHEARTFHETIGSHSTKEYISYVGKGLLPNCPITTEDIICMKTY